VSRPIHTIVRRGRDGAILLLFPADPLGSWNASKWCRAYGGGADYAQTMRASSPADPADPVAERLLAEIAAQGFAPVLVTRRAR
jgi:hypothetical protein